MQFAPAEPRRGNFCQAISNFRLSLRWELEFFAPQGRPRPQGAKASPGVLQSAANYLIEMIAGGNHTLMNSCRHNRRFGTDCGD